MANKRKTLTDCPNANNDAFIALSFVFLTRAQTAQQWPHHLIAFFGASDEFVVPPPPPPPSLTLMAPPPLQRLSSTLILLGAITYIFIRVEKTCKNDSHCCTNIGINF